MTRWMALPWIGVAIGAPVLLAWTGLGARRAHHQAVQTRAQLMTVTAQVRELRGLAAAPPIDRKPGLGLAARVTAALAGCGVATSCLTSVSPESLVEDGMTRRQHAVISLTGVTLPQVGSFLEVWRRAEPQWTVVGIDLSPTATGPAPAGGDLPLHAVVGIEAVAPAHGPSQTGGGR